jgi:hypothetical protein
MLYLCVDYANRWGTIHLRECPCIRGHIAGSNKPISDKRPRWFGPFQTVCEARKCAHDVDHRLAMVGCKCTPYRSTEEPEAATASENARATLGVVENLLRGLVGSRALRDGAAKQIIANVRHLKRAVADEPGMRSRTKRPKGLSSASNPEW